MDVVRGTVRYVTKGLRKAVVRALASLAVPLGFTFLVDLAHCFTFMSK